MTDVSNAIAKLASDRASVGASEERLSFVGNNLSVLENNLSAAKSQISDVDVATESTNYAKFQILVQSGTAMLAQANQKRGKYEYQLEMERRKKEAALREQQRLLQAQIDKEARQQRDEALRIAREAEEEKERLAKAGALDAATKAALEKTIEDETAAAAAPTPVVQPITIEKSSVVRTADGSSYTRFKWVARIVNHNLVPRDCCVPSQKIIDERVKNGERNILGCVIEEIAIPVTRC